MAESRIWRERTEFPRCSSRDVRKLSTAGASRSAIRQAEGSPPVWARTNVSHHRKVSRQLTMVCGLSRRSDLADTIAADRSPRTYAETTSDRASAHRRSVRWPNAGTAAQTSCAGRDTVRLVLGQTRKRPPTSHRSAGALAAHRSGVTAPPCWDEAAQGAMYGMSSRGYGSVAAADPVCPDRRGSGSPRLPAARCSPANRAGWIRCGGAALHADDASEPPRRELSAAWV